MDDGFVLCHVLVPSLRCCAWLSFNTTSPLPATTELGLLVDLL
jgi:hypothetical protein